MCAHTCEMQDEMATETTAKLWFNHFDCVLSVFYTIYSNFTKNISVHYSPSGYKPNTECNNCVFVSETIINNKYK